MSGSIYSSGGQWVLGTAAADVWPNTILGASGTAATSLLLGAKCVLIIGIYVSTAAAVNADIIVSDSVGAVTVITGLTRSCAATGYIPFGPKGVRYERADSANVGIRLGAGAVATLFYRKLA